MGLRETLEAATPPLLTVEELNERIAQAKEVLDRQAAYDIETVVQADKDRRRYEYLRRYAVELEERTALALDMGEALRLAWDEDTWDEFLETDTTALLARLDQLGEEQT